MRGLHEASSTFWDGMVRANDMLILDSSGRPFRMVAHEAASRTSDELARWNPSMLSADAAYLPEREILQSRTADMIRNNGIASGAVQIHLDNVIGSGLTLSAKPDAPALGIEQDAAEELEEQIETRWRQWAYDIDCHCDATRQAQFPGLLAQAYRSYLTAFEITASAEWLPRRRAYATAIQLIDPLRLSQPQGMPENDRMRAGIEFDALGAPIAYHVSSEHRISPFMSDKMLTWTRIPRETSWGRTRFIHIFDIEQPGLSRGKNGIVSVLSKLKMLEKFEQASLQAAILNAVYAAVIESPMDWQSVGGALGAGAEADPMLQYMGNVSEWHKASKIRYNGLQIPHLFPGEKFELKSPEHPMANFGQFEEAVLRYIAAGYNLSYEQLSRDYSKTNYSSARAAMLESYRFFHGRQTFIGGRFASVVYALWMEEAFDRGDLQVPAGAPSFWDAKTAYTRAQWIGPGRGHVDPLKEANGDKVYFSMGVGTLEEMYAARGQDWREQIRQRAQERKFVDELGQAGDYDRMAGAATPVAQPPEVVLPEQREDPAEAAA